MTDIDWKAVYWACNGTRLKLTADEKRMVIRRLDERMLNPDDWGWSRITGAKLTATTVAEWLVTTERSVVRFRVELPPAEKRRCPRCSETMWLLSDGIVEPHPDRYFDECEMSGKPLRGLAAVRPDLYGWVDA